MSNINIWDQHLKNQGELEKVMTKIGKQGNNTHHIKIGYMHKNR